LIADYKAAVVEYGKDLPLMLKLAVVRQKIALSPWCDLIRAWRFYFLACVAGPEKLC
jgi:hypothetical protein